MPVATANGKRFTFPDGTTPEQMGQAIDEYFSQNSTPEEQPAPTMKDPLSAMYEQPASPEQRPAVPTGRGRYGQQEQRAAYDEKQALKVFDQIQAGEISAADLPPEQVEAVRKARINSLPELQGLGANIDYGSALAGMTAFDPAEMGAIISKSDPNIGVVTTPDGETIAVNNTTGAAVNLNKAGPSMTDAIQLGAATAVFSPASRAAALPMMALGGAGTQALIETGQELAGGEFNPGDVALAGAAPIIMRQLGRGAKGTFNYLRPKTTTNYFEQQAKQVAGQEGKAVAQQADDILNQIPKKRAEIRQAIKEGTIEGVGWKVDRRGNVVKDKVQRELIKSGIDSNAVGTMNRMTQGDKAAAGKMIQKYEDILRNVKGSESRRPAEVIGEVAMKRFNTIKDYQTQAQKQITKAVSDDLRGQSVNIQGAVDDFTDDLVKLGIDVGEDGVLDFSQTTVTGNKAPIKEAWRLVKSMEYDGAKLHDIKKALSDLVYNASKQEPTKGSLNSQAQNAIRVLRGKINGQLRDISESYAEGNDKFAGAAKAIEPFTKGMTKRFDPEFDQIDNFVGQELRKTLSNYGKAAELRSSIQQMDDFSRSIGGVYDDDIMNLVVFNTELEKLGSSAPNSFQGNIERGVRVGADAAGLGRGATALEAGYNIAKDRLVFTKPKEETIKILKDMKKLLNQ